MSPWNLNTPVAVGDLDPSGDYPEICITFEMWDKKNKLLQIRWVYGRTVGEDFVEGIAPHGAKTEHVYMGDEYDAIIASDVPDGVTKTYAAVKQNFYEDLIAKGHIPAGSMV